MRTAEKDNTLSNDRFKQSFDRSAGRLGKKDYCLFDEARFDVTEPTVQKYFKEMLTNVYSDQEAFSLEKHPNNYLVWLEVLEDNRTLLSASWIYYGKQVDNIIFLLLSHEIIAIIFLWETEDYDPESADYYLKALLYLVSTASIRHKWVAEHPWHQNVSAWEKAMEGIEFAGDKNAPH